MGSLQPGLVEVGVALRDLDRRKPLPLAKVQVQQSRQRLDGQPVMAGDGGGGLHSAAHPAGIDGGDRPAICHVAQSPRPASARTRPTLRRPGLGSAPLCSRLSDRGARARYGVICSFPSSPDDQRRWYCITSTNRWSPSWVLLGYSCSQGIARSRPERRIWLSGASRVADVEHCNPTTLYRGLPTNGMQSI